MVSVVNNVPSRAVGTGLSTRIPAREHSVVVCMIVVKMVAVAVTGRRVDVGTMTRSHGRRGRSLVNRTDKMHALHPILHAGRSSWDEVGSMSSAVSTSSSLLAVGDMNKSETMHGGIVSTVGLRPDRCGHLQVKSLRISVRYRLHILNHWDERDTYVRSDTVESSNSVDGVRDLAKLADGSEGSISIPELLDESKQLAMCIQDGLGYLNNLGMIGGSTERGRGVNGNLAQVSQSLIAGIFVAVLRLRQLIVE